MTADTPRAEQESALALIAEVIRSSSFEYDSSSEIAEEIVLALKEAGYVIVPWEATGPMLVAGIRAHGRKREWSMAEVYAAMISKSQEPPHA